MIIGRAPKKRSLFASTWDDRWTRATIRYPLVPSLGYCQLLGKINQRSLPLAAVSESCQYCAFPLIVLFNITAALLWLLRTWWQNKKKMLVPKRLQEIRPVHLSFFVIPVSYFYFLHPIFTPTLSNPCLVLLAVTFYLLQVFYSRPKTNLPPGSVSYLARRSLSFLLGPLY